jgi:Subtilase family
VVANSPLLISDCESRITRYKARVKWRPFLYITILLCCAFSLRLGLRQGDSFNGPALNEMTSKVGESHALPLKELKQQTQKQTFRQLAYSSGNLNHRSQQRLEGKEPVTVEIPGRRIPKIIPFSELLAPQLPAQTIELPTANTLAHVNFHQQRFGILQSSTGETISFNPEIILVKFRDTKHVAALRVEPMREWNAVQLVRQRADVQFAELDTFQERQFTPDDPFISNQWHHQMIGSEVAWENGLGQSSLRIAIVDTPFQMNHRDLMANTTNGWDVVANAPITAHSGIDHSTISAGLAAGVVGNHLGIAGAGNCQILPINIEGAISQMYDAIIWAADHDVRVVNISWSGANSDTLETAAYYLKTHARGIVAMPGVNGTGFLNYTNQPDIYCVSMTDGADNVTGSYFGNHIDFAAPGWQIYSTTTNNSYASGSGTSYATPLFSGIVGVLMSINPTLSPEELIDILKTTAVDKGQPGWDQFYGWGRVDFGAAANAVTATLPKISGIRCTNNQVFISAAYKPGLNYSLWKATILNPANWTQVAGSPQTNLNTINWIDSSASSDSAFYKVQVILP